MNIISNLIKKIKFKQLVWAIIFLICILIGILMIILLKQSNTYSMLVTAIIISIIPCTIGMLYFFKRFKNIDSLIKYYGSDEIDYDFAFKSNAAYETKIIYKSPNHALLNHIFITDDYIISIDNAIEIIPIRQIQDIKFIQTKGVINSSTALSPNQWQNTALMTLGRGYPDTIYCYYNVEISINDQIIKISLIKDVGENVLKILRNILPMDIKILTISDFDDTIDKKIGKRKFLKAVLPGFLYLLALGLLFLFFY